MCGGKKVRERLPKGSVLCEGVSRLSPERRWRGKKVWSEWLRFRAIAEKAWKINEGSTGGLTEIGFNENLVIFVYSCRESQVASELGLESRELSFWVPGKLTGGACHWVSCTLLTRMPLAGILVKIAEWWAPLHLLHTTDSCTIDSGKKNTPDRQEESWPLLGFTLFLQHPHLTEPDITVSGKDEMFYKVQNQKAGPRKADLAN